MVFSKDYRSISLQIVLDDAHSFMTKKSLWDEGVSLAVWWLGLLASVAEGVVPSLVRE